MKEHKTIAGKLYTVTSPNGCTVTDETGLQLGTVEAGEQKAFTATGGAMWLDDTAARVTANFKQAPVKLKILGLLGGGVSTGLPSGYLQAEFLESTGQQYIDTGKRVPINYSLHATAQYTRVNSLSHMALFGWGSGDFKNVLLAWVVKDYNKFYIRVNDKATSLSGDSLVLEKFKLTYNGSTQQATLGDITLSVGSHTVVEPSENFGLFSAIRESICYCPTYSRIYNFEIIDAVGNEFSQFIPALDPTGAPCMYDKVTKQPFYNNGSGVFIVGMTIEQARKLSRLPKTGGTLRVSLPSNYLEDEGMTKAITAANAKGWNIEVASTFEADGASATFALRRIWVRKTQDEHGNYIDSDGVRWQVESCVAMYNADGSEPDAHGYEPFRSVEVATEYWGLTPWVNPEAEEELLTDTEEQ